MTIKVLYVVNSGLTSPTGGGRTRIIAAAKQGLNAGYSVRIVCFFRPQDAVLRFGLLSAGLASLRMETGCPSHLIPRLPMTRITVIQKLNDFYCGVMVALLCWLFGLKVAHGHGLRPTIFALRARSMYRGLKVVADIHGAATEEYLYARKLTHHDKTALELEKQEAVMLRQSDWLIFVSNAMRDFYEKKFELKLLNYSIIPCAAESDFEIDNVQRESMREEFGLKDKLIFCYVGDCESYQLPDVMCRIFEEMRREFPNSFFLIFSHHRKNFFEHLRAAGVPSKNYLVLSVEHTKIFALLQMADIGLLLRDDSVVNRVASPVKFGEYCLCGVPVISSDCIGDASKLVADHKLGAIIDSSMLSSSILTAGIKDFVADVQENRAEYALSCVTFARTQYRWDAYGPELSGIYSKNGAHK